MAARNESRANPAAKAEKQIRAYELKLRGLSLRAISAQMQAEGYEGVSHEAVRQLISAEADSRVTPFAAEYRTMQLDQLDSMRHAVIKVLETQHWTVSQGRVVYMGDDEEKQPLEDDGPVLAAVDRLLRIAERESKLLGLDAPARAEIESRVEQIAPDVLSLIEAAEADADSDEAAIRDGSD
ncbi:hypothetical protein AB0383_48635 [Amycolatopsis sp. NPDC051373]|uniref:hypothetical protein n=1 Tax=Amycolatopsis sp. NPDC051373 TaxID=3155801 RepID=UPI00344D6FAF